MLFSTECNPYFDWQSAGLIHSHKVAYEAAGLEPCPMTRLMACDNPTYPVMQLPEYPFLRTHVHPPFNNYEGDTYSAYNKPGSVMHWMEHGDTAGTEWVVIIDADMIILKPFLMDKLRPRPKAPISAYYAYLTGVDPEVHMGVKSRLVEPRKDPNVQYSKIGGFAVHHVGELLELSREWLQLSAAVRKDPDSWAHTGDIFNCPQQDKRPGCQGEACGCVYPPWISEMYGYVFASAVVGVQHQVNNKVMLYPDYMPHAKAADGVSPDKDWPLVMHYGLTYHMDLKSGFSWSFDKHWYKTTDMISCPGKLFMQPPEREELKIEGLNSMQLYAQDLAWQTAHGLHSGLTAYHQTHCLGQQPVQFPLKLFRCSKNEANLVLTCDDVGFAAADASVPGKSTKLRGGEFTEAGNGGGVGASRKGGESSSDGDYEYQETDHAEEEGRRKRREKPNAPRARVEEPKAPSGRKEDVHRAEATAKPGARGRDGPRSASVPRAEPREARDMPRGETSTTRGESSLSRFKMYIIGVWVFAFLGIIAYSRDFRRRRPASRKPGLCRLPR